MKFSVYVISKKNNNKYLWLGKYFYLKLLFGTEEKNNIINFTDKVFLFQKCIVYKNCS